jgi:hypothetical protein
LAQFRAQVVSRKTQIGWVRRRLSAVALLADLV